MKHRTAGDIIRDLRKKRGLTIDQLISEANLDVGIPYISLIETNKEIASYSIIKRLAAFFDIPLSEIEQALQDDKINRYKNKLVRSTAYQSNSEKFGHTVRLLRKQHNFTILEFIQALDLGISPNYWGCIERDLKWPPIHCVIKIEKYFKFIPYTLMNLTSDEQKKNSDRWIEIKRRNREKKALLSTSDN